MPWGPVEAIGAKSVCVCIYIYIYEMYSYVVTQLLQKRLGRFHRSSIQQGTMFG